MLPLINIYCGSILPPRIALKIIMPKPPPVKARVLNKAQVSTNFLRITFTSGEFENFPKNCEGWYIKLAFDEKGQALRSTAEKNAQAIIAAKQCTLRSFTIRSIDHQSHTLSIDCALHSNIGTARAWLSEAQINDEIYITHPGPVALTEPSADWFLLAGDSTALAAIAVNLEKLPAQAEGYAVLEVASTEDKIELNAPQGIKIHWLINPKPHEQPSELATTVKQLDWLGGTPSIWVACEFDTMKEMRSYFRLKSSIDKSQYYLSSYWKSGETDEGHKAAKKRDKAVS